MTRQRWLLAAAVGVVALLFVAGRRYSYGGGFIGKGIYGRDTDPQKLLPTFAGQLETLFRRLRDKGWDPVLWEAYRSPERVALTVKTGTGVTNSLHPYGAAADIRRLSNPNAPGAAFWAALGAEAEALGLTWGGRFSKDDPAHVQAITVAEQKRFQSLPDAAAREAYLQGRA